MGSRIEIDCLNCGAGDISLTWNANDPMEIERAMRVVKDMLRRGYALFVKGADGKMTKVKGLDESAGAYLIADGPDGSAPAPEPVKEPEPGEDPTYFQRPSQEVQAKVEEAGKKKRGRPVKMSHAKVVAVGRSAGG